MNIFNFDIQKYAVLVNAPFLRGGIFSGFLMAFVNPLIDVYIDFLKNRKLNVIKLTFNYQVCSVEYRLNDAFDPLERRIKIVNAVQYEGVYLYTASETSPTDPDYFSWNYEVNKMKWLDENHPIYLRTEAELYSEFDFIVEIPNTNINQIRLKAEIDFYILPSKRYQIVII